MKPFYRGSSSFKNFTRQNICLQLIYTNEQNLALNTQQGFIYKKTQAANQPIPQLSLTCLLRQFCQWN